MINAVRRAEWGLPLKTILLTLAVSGLCAHQVGLLSHCPSQPSQAAIRQQPPGFSATQLPIPSPNDTAVEADSCPRLADLLVGHWRNRTQLSAQHLAASTSRSTAAVLAGLGMNTESDYCYCKLKFNGSAVSIVDTLTEHCQGETGKLVLLRAHIYVLLLNRILAQRSAAQRLTPFEFYLDLTSGTRNNVGLFQQLGIPIFSFSRNPHDRHTLPLPDVHMVMGIFGRDLRVAEAFPDLADFIKGELLGMEGIYRDHGWEHPWSAKVPKLVFRGSCYPTLASDNMYPHTRVDLRAQLCKAHHGRASFDMGMELGVPPCNAVANETHPLCAGCQLCQNATRLSPAEQSQYKYQVIVDGQASTNDASVWKLLSNSAVIRLRPDGWSAPIFEQFYDPALLPNVHLLHADVRGLPGAIRWCEGNPGPCEQLGSRSRSLMKCLLQPQLLEEYIYGVFTYAHDSVKQ